MPRPRAGKPKRKDVSAKIDAEVSRLGKMVAQFHGQTFAEWLSEVVKPIAVREWNAILSGKAKPKSQQ